MPPLPGGVAMAAMVSLSIGDGEGDAATVQEAFWKVATKDFFNAEVLILDYPTLMLVHFPT
jgi:hypothetical protein